MWRPNVSTAFAWASGLLLLLAPVVRSETPLHQRIDQVIAAGKANFEMQAAPLASDAEFMRRVCLDLNGSIPPANEVRAFLDDHALDKRARLIDRLLASPAYARRMAAVFDVLLMERRPDKNVPRAQWQEYLQESFAANKPLDQLVREILSADGSDPRLRAAAKFYLDRDGEPNQLTRDIGRLFLGMNLQCAQCHDHPLVDDYKQGYYYGILAFLNRSYLFGGKGSPVVLAEKAEGEVSYQSVFDPAKVTKTTGPRLPGRPPVAEPKLAKGEEYATPPAKNVRPVPSFSRRGQLAGQITDRGNVAFRRALANRLWALLMGRGLVQPLDLDHSANPPSHPELLSHLADELAARKYNLRDFLRQLALSRTYQRSSQAPADGRGLPPESFAVDILKPLSPEQLAWSLMQATGLMDAERLALGKKAAEDRLVAGLAGNVKPFVATFGGQPGQPEGQSFESTLDQSLFLSNGALVRGWLAPRPGNLVDRLLHIPDAASVADELYLSVLTRRPTEEEQREVADYIRQRIKDRPAALQEVAWALLASAEFRFNH
jgi:hypothetical protein